MTRVPIALFGNRAKAEPIQRRLTENGIKAEVHDELRLEKLWFVSKPAAGARIEVPADQFERACQFLVEWVTGDGALRDAIRCPECRSLRIDYPQFTRKSMLPNLVMGFLAAIGQVEKQFYCQDCHYTWPREGTKSSALKPNMAPYYFIEGVEQTSLTKARQEQKDAAHGHA
jgi:predicted Zn-ribbon and HTH transcriptional regulator